MERTRGSRLREGRSASVSFNSDSVELYEEEEEEVVEDVEEEGKGKAKLISTVLIF